ncbi:MAG TPA: YihY/virulence factor BrkB family protein [Blastocatellia bacterium]|nr:YihY/virulence factor BrkB family protein [Blastocatellia bacterium]
MLKGTWDEFQRDDAIQLGAALAFYASFSLFPLLILMLAAIGFVLQHYEPAIDAQYEILRAAARTFSPEFSRILRRMLIMLQDQAVSATWAGSITLFFGASSVFHQLNNSLKKIWQVPENEPSRGMLDEVINFIGRRLYAVFMMLILGLLLIISIALTALSQSLLGLLTYLPTFPTVNLAAAYLVGMVVTLSINTLIFALIFKYLPGTKVLWGDVLLGAFVTAVLWEVAKRLLAIYIEHSSYSNAYGVVGAMLALMAWIYFSSQVLFFGAEFTELYSRRHGSRAAPAVRAWNGGRLSNLKYQS